MKIINILLIIFIALWGCATSVSSMEFRTAKTAARSEKNLKRAEEWGVKALDLEIHSQDALVPYFIATEIYKPQKKWEDMAMMMFEALDRNASQNLEKPIPINDGTIARTIADGYNIYKPFIWSGLFNHATDLYNKSLNNDDNQKLNQMEAIRIYELALKVDPNRAETYIVLAKFHHEINKPSPAKEFINIGLTLESLTKEQKTELFLIYAELYKKEQNLELALEFYEKAYLENNESIIAILGIMRANLILNNFLEAIKWGDIAINNRSKIERMYFGDLYWNMAVAYWSAAASYNEKAMDVVEIMNENNETVSSALKRDATNNLKIAIEYFENAADYFYSAADYDILEGESRYNECQKWIKQIKEVYFPYLSDDTPQ